MGQNVRQLQILHANDMVKQDANFIVSCLVSSSIHMDTFNTKRKVTS